MDSGDWTVIAVGIALAGICITLAAFILNTVRGIRADMRGIRADMRDIRADMRALLERQDKLPERLGRQEQEQARMNGMLETIRAGLSYRVERADAGERVAEDAESYEPEG